MVDGGGGWEGDGKGGGERGRGTSCPLNRRPRRRLRYRRPSAPTLWRLVAVEHIKMQESRHQEVRDVHELVDMEINRSTGQHVGLLAAQPAGLHEVVDHVERGVPRRQRQIFALILSMRVRE